jgi:hypothetical protein
MSATFRDQHPNSVQKQFGESDWSMVAFGGPWRFRFLPPWGLFMNGTGFRAFNHQYQEQSSCCFRRHFQPVPPFPETRKTEELTSCRNTFNFAYRTRLLLPLLSSTPCKFGGDKSQNERRGQQQQQPQQHNHELCPHPFPPPTAAPRSVQRRRLGDSDGAAKQQPPVIRTSRCRRRPNQGADEAEEEATSTAAASSSGHRCSCRCSRCCDNSDNANDAILNVQRASGSRVLSAHKST